MNANRPRVTAPKHALLVAVCVATTCSCYRSTVGEDDARSPPDASVTVTDSGIGARDAGFDAPACSPTCAERECGADGCGGLCGPGCAPGVSCDETSGRCGAVRVLYRYSYCGCEGTTTMRPGDVFEIYDEPGGGAGRDVARCYLGADGLLRAYNLDSVAAAPVWGDPVSARCSVAAFRGYVVMCCFT